MYSFTPHVASAHSPSADTALSTASSSSSSSAARPLTAPAANALLDQLPTVQRDLHSLIAFLRSTDRGASLHQAERQSLLERCTAATDTTYLQDVWPDVGQGVRRWPKHQTPPPLTERHQAIAHQNAQALGVLLKEVHAIAQRNLDQVCAVVDRQLSDVELEMQAWPIRFDPPACVEARSRLSAPPGRIVQSPQNGYDCFIDPHVRRLLTRTPIDLPQTLQCVRTMTRLLQDRSGRLSILSAERQPEYFARWLKLRDALLADDVRDFQSNANHLSLQRAHLLGLSPPRPGHTRVVLHVDTSADFTVEPEELSD